MQSRKKVLISVLAVAVAVAVLGVGIKARNTWVGERITECGFDANGPYAKVRINSLVGGLGQTSHKQVGVGFTYRGLPYTNQPHIVDGLGMSKVKLPVFGTTTTVVHGIYPSRVLLTKYKETTPKGDVQWPGGRKITVEGRVVYRESEPPFKLVTKKFIAQHPRRHVNEEIVPYDRQRISCSL